MTITSPHNDKLKEIRRLARRRARDDAARFVAEGEDLLAAAARGGLAAGAPAVRRRAVGRRRARSSRRCSRRSRPRARARARSASTRQRWGAPAGPLCVALWGVGDPGNVGTILRSRARLRRRRRSCSAPAAPTRSGRRRCARRWARSSPCRSRGRASPTSCRASAIALVARAGRAAARPGGERGDARRRRRAGRAAAEVVAGCDRVAHIPIASESLNAAMAATVALTSCTQGAQDAR